MYWPFAAATFGTLLAHFVGRVLRGEFREDYGHHGPLGKGDHDLLRRVRQQIGSAPFWLPSNARASDPGRCTVSASVNKQPLRARCFRSGNDRIVLSRPTLPCTVPAEITRTPAKLCAISRVRSVEPSSTTMISNATPVCAVKDCRQPPRLSSSFRAGIIIETSRIRGSRGRRLRQRGWK